MVEPAGGFALPAHRNLGDAINGADHPEGMALVDLGAGAAPRTYTYREFDGSPPRSRAAWFASCSPRPADVGERTSCRLHAYFPKCRHRRDPAAWSGGL